MPGPRVSLRKSRCVAVIEIAMAMSLVVRRRFAIEEGGRCLLPIMSSMCIVWPAFVLYEAVLG